jgi:hypothetical protein
MLRRLAKRTVWAGVAGLALAGTASAQVPDDPIAASNRLVDPWVAPKAPVAPADTPWLATTAEPAGKALLARIVGAPNTAHAPTTVSLPTTVSAPPVVNPPTPAEPAQVNWSSPTGRPITSTLPTTDRPMVPCEPVVIAPPAAPKPPPSPPIEVLPPPRVLTPQDAPPPPPPAPTMKSTAPDDDLSQRTVTTIRFLDDPQPIPAADDDVLLAVVRRGGAATGTAADIRTAVERACHGKAECQTEVAGERQVRVMLKVHSRDDWHRLYERMQQLPELGEYGLLFQVRVEIGTESKK